MNLFDEIHSYKISSFLINNFVYFLFYYFEFQIIQVELTSFSQYEYYLLNYHNINLICLSKKSLLNSHWGQKINEYLKKSILIEFKF